MADMTDDQVRALLDEMTREVICGELDKALAERIGRALLDARAELAAAQQREAGLVERAEKAEAERDKWFEGAGAHHVASMQQAQRADIAEAELAAIRKGETL